MKLTQEFRKITAVFDSPVNYTDDHIRIHGFNKSFKVGDVTYTVNIGYNDGQWEIQFFLARINKTGQDLADFISQILGRQVSITEAIQLNQMGLGYHSVGVTGTGSSARVLSNVISIIKDFIKDKPGIKCLNLRSQDNPLADNQKARTSRTDLYRRIIKREFPDFIVNEHTYQEYGVSETNFRICRSA